MYGLTPLVAIAMTVLSISLYWNAVQPLVYSISLSAFMFVGWLITVIFWGRCVHDGDRGSRAAWTKGKRVIRKVSPVEESTD